jgi:hypothetical protein
MDLLAKILLAVAVGEAVIAISSVNQLQVGEPFLLESS